MSEITKDEEQNSNTPTYTGVKVVPVVDARGDSILNRSRTETYEANDEKGMFEILKNSNFTHVEEEKKRDDANRLNAKKIQETNKAVLTTSIHHTPLTTCILTYCYTYTYAHKSNKVSFDLLD